MVEAGWDVAELDERDDGSVMVLATKEFSDPAALDTVLTELSGTDGPFARLGLRSDRSFARTAYRFEGVLDGSVGIAAFVDPGLAAALDGLPFGVDLAELQSELGVSLGSLVTVRLLLALPGDHEGNLQPSDTITDRAADGSARTLLVWETDLDAVDPVPVLATSEIVRMQSIVLAAAAAGFAGLFVLILLLWLIVMLRRRRRRRRAVRAAAATPRPIVGGAPRDPDDTPVPVSAPQPALEPTGDQPPPDRPPPLELVVIGGPGVAFGVRDIVDDVVAFARAHGSMLEYPRIAEHYALAELGRLSSAELWVAIGAEGEPAELDEVLLGRYQLATGLREFVVRARDRGYRVAYLGDGPVSWVDRLRRSFVLTDLIDPWVVSAAVGVRTPEPAIFEALRRMSGVAPSSCLLIDDRLRVLEAAHQLGFGTSWFSPTGRATEAPGHSIIRGFTDLLAAD
jgi:FMN phosphatase YigB (HAD superfamily)